MPAPQSKPEIECGSPSLAARLCDLRQKSRRSAAAVARAAGISRQHLWRIETGVVVNPSPEILERLASVYGTSLSQLLERASPPSGRSGTLLRLVAAAEAISEEEWRMLARLADRVSAAPPARRQPGYCRASYRRRG